MQLLSLFWPQHIFALRSSVCSSWKASSAIGYRSWNVNCSLILLAIRAFRAITPGCLEKVQQERLSCSRIVQNMTKYAAWQRNNHNCGTRTAGCRRLMTSDTVLLTQNPLEETRLLYISTPRSAIDTHISGAVSGPHIPSEALSGSPIAMLRFLWASFFAASSALTFCFMAL